MNKKKILIIFMAVTALLLCGGCGRQKAVINCPFTELVWDSTTDDMIALEGDGFDTYESIYKGMTYTYPKEYLGKAGMIKYMYDADGKLCNVSWSYTGEAEEELMDVYRAVCDEAAKLHGRSTNDDGVGNYCETWITDGGTVMANAVVTNDTKVMQIAYMNPEVSKLDDVQK